MLLLLLTHNSGEKRSGNKHNKAPLPAIYKLTKASTNEVLWHFEKDRFFQKQKKYAKFFLQLWKASERVTNCISKKG